MHADLEHAVAALSRQGGIFQVQGFEDFAVFCQRLFQATLEPQRIAASELDDLARIIDQLPKIAVTGDFLQGFVETLVGFKKAVGVVGSRMLFKFRMDRGKPGKVGAGGTLRRFCGGLRAAPLPGRPRRCPVPITG